MTITALVLDLSTCLAAFIAFCLSMGRHYGVVFGGKPPHRRLSALRAVGWTLLALSLMLAVLEDGIEFGLVLWFGVVTAAALTLVGLLTYRPSWIVWAAIILPPTAVMVGLVAWSS